MNATAVIELNALMLWFAIMVWGIIIITMTGCIALTIIVSKIVKDRPIFSPNEPEGEAFNLKDELEMGVDNPERAEEIEKRNQQFVDEFAAKLGLGGSLALPIEETPDEEKSD